EGDGLYASGAVAAGVGGRPGAQNRRFACAIGAAGGISEPDAGYAAASVSSGGDARVVSDRGDGAFQSDVRRTGDKRRHRVFEADGLHASGAIAAAVGRGPGAKDGGFARAV